jgi:hypothetical protein
MNVMITFSARYNNSQRKPIHSSISETMLSSAFIRLAAAAPTFLFLIQKTFDNGGTPKPFHKPILVPHVV